jgi:hypothetical protein
LPRIGTGDILAIGAAQDWITAGGTRTIPSNLNLSCTARDSYQSATPPDYSASMDEYTADAFVNRGEPVPVIKLGDRNAFSDDADSDHGAPSVRKRDRLKKHTANLKETFLRGHGKPESGRGISMQDRLLEKYTLITTGNVKSC